MTGVVKKLMREKGFGFIRDGSGQEYFFHRSALLSQDYDELIEGDAVVFELGDGAKGPRAEHVERQAL